MKKKIIEILLCMLLIIIIFSMTVAADKNDNVRIQSTTDHMETYHMTGLMHVYHKKTGWGWTEIWRPICILSIGPQGKQILGPSSESFTPYEISGFIGPRYFLLSYPYRSGSFFLSGHITPWVP